MSLVCNDAFAIEEDGQEFSGKTTKSRALAREQPGMRAHVIASCHGCELLIEKPREKEALDAAYLAYEGWQWLTFVAWVIISGSTMI